MWTSMTTTILLTLSALALAACGADDGPAAPDPLTRPEVMALCVTGCEAVYSADGCLDGVREYVAHACASAMCDDSRVPDACLDELERWSECRVAHDYACDAEGRFLQTYGPCSELWTRLESCKARGA